MSCPLVPKPPNSSADTSATPGAGFLARVEQVFFEVSALAPRDRDEAIVRLCGGDAALEREVRSLVGSAVQLGSYLEQPALGRSFDEVRSESQRDEPPDGLLGATLGPFTVQTRIASGGMGTVYLAHRSDGQFAQSVAIKVVKRGMDSEEILRRFTTERQTLAALDHPNIARLIDGGLTPDGRPFVVMEHVDGKPIDRYCDEKGLGLKDRLRLFRQVCDGVHHAHQNLVLHRDLKPSNILVTAQGVPKLLDFGIAKVLTGGTAELASSVTAETDRRLTPEYASPEQVEGRPLTTASDVYGLGVVLYELLTGTRPYHFGLRTQEEVRRVVCTLEPVPPSQAVTVRVSRLKTAGVATPPASHLDAQSTNVRPGALNGAAAGAHATLVPTIDVPKTRGVTSTRLRGLLRGDLDVIVLMALRKEPERRYASAEQFSADIGRFLEGMPVQARRDTLGYRVSKFVRRHAVSVSLTMVVFALLTGATTILYRQDNQLRRQRSELIALNHRLDENLKRLGESRRFLQTVVGGAGAANQGPDARLGEVLEQAAATLKSAPPQDPLTLAAAQLEVGRAMMSLGMLADAKPLLEAAARAYAVLPVEADARMDAETALAELAFYEDRPDAAEKEFLRLLSLERAKGHAAPSGRESELLNDLGSTYRAQGRTDESIATQREALAATIAVLGPDSLEAAETRNNLASALFQKGDYEGAIGEFTKALEARNRTLRPSHPLVVRCQSNLGLAKLRAGQIEDAVMLLTQAADHWEAAFGPEHPGRVATFTSLAQALRKQGRPADAIVRLQEALAWQQRHQPNPSEAIAATEANIGLALAEQGRAAEAIETIERAIPVLKAAGNSPALLKTATETLATLHEQAGNADRARQLRAEER